MHDDRQDFLYERQRRLESIPPDHGAWTAARDFFASTLPLRYSYNFDWLGVPIIEYPQDIIAMQELCWRVQPDLIVETGVARGGSVIFYASMLKLLGGDRTVVGVDIDIRPHNRTAIESHPVADRVVLIEGSSTSEEVAAEVYRHAERAKRTMVILDSHHTKDHVARELELYAPLVRKGSYLVVFDTIVEYMPPETVADREWGPGNSPLNAVQDFLAGTDRFVADRAIDAKLMVSVAPSGYLECVKDPS